MSELNNIFGIKESNNNLVRPERQSIEQTEDVAIKKVVFVKELYFSATTYFKYNETTHELELYVNGGLISSW